MLPCNFPEATHTFGPPPDFSESQIAGIRAHVKEIKQGNLDGSMAVIVAWKPTQNEFSIARS